MKLSGIMINSEKPKELAAFYTKVLGKPGWEDGDFFGFGQAGSNILVGPHSEVKGKNADAPRIMIAFAVKDVKAEFDKLTAAGGTTIAEPYNPDSENKDMWLATVADPDGNYLQLSTPWT